MKSKNPNAEILDLILRHVMESAEKAGIIIWLECGTLLGYIREQDYIPWEEDIDFGALSADINIEASKIFSSYLMQLGYQVTLYDSYWHIAVPKSECHADVNIYSIQSDEVAVVSLMGPGNSFLARTVDAAVRIVSQRPLGVPEKSNRFRDVLRIRLQQLCVWLPKPMERMLTQMLNTVLKKLEIDISWRVPSYLICESRPTQFRDIKVNVPVKAEQYLKYRYGDDWAIPRQLYDTWKEDGAIV